MQNKINATALEELLKCKGRAQPNMEWRKDRVYMNVVPVLPMGFNVFAACELADGTKQLLMMHWFKTAEEIAAWAKSKVVMLSHDKIFDIKWYMEANMGREHEYVADILRRNGPEGHELNFVKYNMTNFMKNNAFDTTRDLINSNKVSFENLNNAAPEMFEGLSACLRTLRCVTDEMIKLQSNMTILKRRDIIITLAKHSRYLCIWCRFIGNKIKNDFYSISCILFYIKLKKIVYSVIILSPNWAVSD